MSYLNKIFLMGRLTREVDYRATQSGNNICTLGLAVSRKFNQNGQEKEEVCFVDVKVWGKQAESCRNYLSKGSQVIVEGRLTLDQWEDKQSGEKRQKLSVTAENVQFVGSRRDDNGNYGGYQQQSRGVDSNYAPQQMPQENGYCPDNIEDNDVPF